MAATPVDHLTVKSEARGRRVGVTRLAAAGGISAALVFVICWMGTFIPFGSPTHAYIRLFTLAQMSTVEALIEGTLWSLLFGLLAAGVLGIVYNLLAGLERS